MAKRKKSKSKKTGKWFPWKKLVITLFVVLICAVIYMDAWVMYRFNGSKWNLPAEVFASPMELYAGKAVMIKTVMAELKGTGYVQSQRDQSGTYSLTDNLINLHTRPFTFWDMQQAALSVTLYFESGRVSAIQGLDASMNGSFRLEPIKIGSIHPQQHEDRLIISIDDVPESLIYALLATEDRDFFQHHGISLRGIVRALWANMRHGGIVEGASTLTQQLVKNFFLSPDRTLLRKAEEVIMALLLEFRASKQEILEAYINEVFVAQDGARAIHGFAMASEFFFARPLNQLSVDQIAMLVGMMKGPSYYNPVRHPERAKERRDLVLKLMNEQGYLDSTAIDVAIAQPLNLMVKPDPASPQSYAAYVQLVRQQLSRDYSKNDLQTQGLRIFTNLDPRWQAHAQESLDKGISRLQRRYGKVMGQANGAVVVVNHTTGDVEALVGGKDFRPGSFNRALYADRQIGSLVKPAVYLTALEKGYRLNDLLSDEPLKLTVNKKSWEPQNYGRRSHHLGDVATVDPENKKKGIPLYLAMANSYNIATVRLGMELGVNAVASTLTKLGVDSKIPKVPALFLGVLALTPLEVAQFYATLAGGGFYAPLNTIREVADNEGKPLKRYTIKLEKRFDTDTMHLIDYAMQTVMHEGTGRSVANRFAPNTLIAGKTGTTNDLRDNWFAGYDGERTAVVWVGNDDNKPLPMPAAIGSLPVWADLMTADRGGAGAKPVPDNIEYHWVDIANDKLTEDDCVNAVYLPFIKGTEPKTHTPCYKHKPTDYWFKQWFQ